MRLAKLPWFLRFHLFLLTLLLLPIEMAFADQKALIEHARTYFTDTPLVDQNGQTQRFYSDLLADRVVLINFIYTQCADACPLITQKLNKVREQLGGALGKEFRFLSISVDPDRDHPSQLKVYAERQRADDPEWRFLTGKRGDLETIIGRLGQKQGDLLDHSTLMIAGNVRYSHWVKIHPDASPEYIADTLHRLQEIARP